MSNIQKTLDALQPYVIGIRYVEGTPLVDAVFKEGWSVPNDPKIKQVKGDEGMNYYMLFSEVKGIGLDDLLSFVDRTIKLNVEREKKQDLLRIKVAELKEIFKTSSLTKLKTLKFSFNDSMDDFEINEELEEEEDELVPHEYIEESFPEPTTTIEEHNEIVIPEGYTQLVDEKGNPIELTEEELEELAEEARAEKNRQYLESKKKKQEFKKPSAKVELPPKRKPEPVTESAYESPDCDCDENQACNKCIESKY
jgi:hypothetical protein